MTKSADKKKAILAAVQQGEKSLVFHRAKILINDDVKELESAGYHHQWSDALLYGTENECWEGFRGSGKSQLVLRSYPIHRMQYPTPRCNYIVIIKENAEQASKVLKQIIRERKENPLASANLTRTIEESAQIYHTENISTTGERVEVRIEAYGKGQSIRGLSWGPKRPDIVILDDPQDRNDAKSPTVLQSDWSWFLSDVVFLGSNGSRIFVIANNLGDACIAERLFASEGKLEKIKFRCRRVPGLVNGESAWPARYTKADLEQIKKDYETLGEGNIFYEEIMCQSMAEEMKIFKNTDYKYFTASLSQKIADDAAVYATLDWAVSKDKEKACYRAICVNAVTKENFWHIVEMPFGFWDPKQLIDEVFAVVRRYRHSLVKFGIEKGIFKDAIEPFINDEMIRRKCHFEIVPIEHARAGSKLERVKMLKPRFSSGQIRFPDSAEFNEETKTDWLTEVKHELGGVMRDGFKSEYQDLIDALAMMVQIAEPPVDTEMSQDYQNRVEVIADAVDI